MSAGYREPADSMVDELFIKKIASSARISLSALEIVEMQKTMAQLFKIADTIAEVDIADDVVESNTQNRSAIPISSLRNDISSIKDDLSSVEERTPDGLGETQKVNAIMTKNVNKVTATELIELSPTADDNGFTIPRLME